MTTPTTGAPASSVSLVTPRMLLSPPSLGVVVGLTVAAVAASAGWTVVALVGLAASALAEPFLHLRQPVLIKALRAAAMGLGTRIVLRLLVAAVALAHREPGAGAVLAFGLCAFLFVGVRALYVLVAGQLNARRTPVYETRNIPWTDLRFPRPLPRVLTAWTGSAVSATELFITVPACLPGVSTQALVALGALGVAAQLAVVAVLAWDSRRVGTSLGLEGLQPVVQAWLDRYRPEVVLYFGDNRAAAYQVKMWLTTMEALPQRCLVVLRNRPALAELGPTRLPVLCAPAAVNLMALDMSPFRAALYVSNIGNNIHMLREPGILSSFIGHGDSDKNGSFSPYTRVYDEVWVAGPAGRERYRQADVGVADSAVVEVGRPQLDGLATATPSTTAHTVPRTGPAVAPAGSRPHVPTVLYAPTWEGWNEEQAYGSVATHGLGLVEALVRPGSGVRLVYRPHPFTGQRDPAVRAAHRRILQMIAEANERAGHAPPPGVAWPDVGDLTRIEDPAVRSRASGEDGDPLSATAAEELGARAEAEYWAAADPGAHHVVGQDGPSLLSCFAVADVLVADVSSVLSDFVATGRPYVVCNTSGLPETDFLVQAPSARAGVVLAPDADFGRVARLARGEEPDGLALHRAQLRSELLGPQDPPATARFGAAVTALVRRATVGRAAASALDLDGARR